MPVTRALAAVALLGATATVTACGAGGASSASDANASSSSSSSSGSSVAAGHLDKAGLVQALTVGQLKAGSAHVQMKLSGVTALQAAGDVVYHGHQPEMTMTMSMAQLGSKKLQMRYVGGVFYLAIPPLSPAGKFVKLDPRDKTSPMGRAFGGVTSQLDPLSSFRAMKSAVRSVRYAGHATVGGVATDHYVVKVDTAALLRAEKSHLKVPNLPAQLTYDMWFDHKDLLRQTDYDVSGVHGHMLFSRWGEPVHVTAPPASKVVDAPKLGQAAG